MTHVCESLRYSLQCAPTQSALVPKVIYQQHEGIVPTISAFAPRSLEYFKKHVEFTNILCEEAICSSQTHGRNRHYVSLPHEMGNAPLMQSLNLSQPVKILPKLTKNVSMFSFFCLPPARSTRHIAQRSTSVPPSIFAASLALERIAESIQGSAKWKWLV